MKKIFLLITYCFMLLSAFSQTDRKLELASKVDKAGALFVQAPLTNINDSTCFCCNDFYNLPTPVINGSDLLNCNDKTNFSIRPCPSASYSWTISPAIAFSGQSTNAISITSPFASGTYTISVTISCGRAKVTSSKKVTANCCDCSKLSQKPVITGPTNFCLGKPCDTQLKYTVPNYNDKGNCYAYEWNVKTSTGVAVAITGQATNQIAFNCSNLNAGVYTISIIITCGGKAVANSIPLLVCKKPDPSFNMSSNGNSVSFSSTMGCTNYWYFFEDINGNCLHDGDATEPPTGQIGNSVTFNNLIANKQYVVHHYIKCSCGPGLECVSFQAVCFRWLPAQMMKTGKGAKGVEIISDKIMEEVNQIPAQVLKTSEGGKN